MKVIPGSNPPMYIEENGSVKDQYFRKVPHQFDVENDNHAFVNVAGKKRYVGALMLETYGDDPRPARNSEVFSFINDDNTDFRPDNLEYKPFKATNDPDHPKYGAIREVGEAGKVDDDDVPEIPDDVNTEDSTVNKKDLIKAAFMQNEKATYNEVIEGIKEDHGVEVSAAYVANVKKDMGLTGK